MQVALVWALVAGGALTAPLWLPESAVLIVALTLLTASGAIALSLVSGTAGLLSLGYVAFLAAGGFTAGFLIELHGWPALPALLAGGTVAAILGAIVAIPSLRWRGIYVILGTFGLQYVVLFSVNEIGRRLERPNGFSFGLLEVGPAQIITTAQWYYVMLALCAVCAYVMRTLTDVRSSRMGRAWIAARENRIVAGAVGVNVAHYNVLAFAVSSFLIGVVGGIFGYFVGILSYEPLTEAISIQYLCILLLGGLGSLSGAFIGAAFYTAVPFVVRALTDYLPANLDLGQHASAVQMAIFGITLILVVSFEPKGLVHLLGRGRFRSAATPVARDLPSTTDPRDAPTPEKSPSAHLMTPTGGEHAVDLLHATNLSVEYGRRTMALDRIELTIVPGAVVGILGPNGAGKTSLLRALSGFTPAETGEVTTGEVFWKGRQLSGLGPTERSRMGIVLVSEREKIFKSLTVMDNLLVAQSGASGMSIEALLELFPVLARRIKSQAGFLSGGERQMLALARALYQGPELLLVDELSLGLAPVAVRSLIEAVITLRSSRQLAMVLVEQNASILMDIVDELHLMRNGRIVRSGVPSELHASGALEDVLLGRVSDEIHDDV